MSGCRSWLICLPWSCKRCLLHGYFSRTHYLQHYLEVFHVAFFSLYQLMDVILSLFLLKTQRVQTVRISTPCRKRTHNRRVLLLECINLKKKQQKPKNWNLKHTYIQALHVLPPAGYENVQRNNRNRGKGTGKLSSLSGNSLDPTAGQTPTASIKPPGLDPTCRKTKRHTLTWHRVRITPFWSVISWLMLPHCPFFFLFICSFTLIRRLIPEI